MTRCPVRSNTSSKSDGSGVDCRGSDAADPAVADGDPAILEDAILSVHGEHSASVEKRRTHLTPVR